MSDYYAESSSGGYLSEPPFKRSSSIRSEGQLDLRGPLEVLGSVKAGRGINFDGDIIVRDKIDAYGNIDVDGNLSCELVRGLCCSSEHANTDDMAVDGSKHMVTSS
jgi:cytoskeletal protein CcmA (bactofilin family)